MKIDTIDLSYAPLNDVQVLRALIASPYTCHGIGIHEDMEELICMYADLDRLIQEAPLTKSEKAVLEMKRGGYGSKEIAAERKVSVQTCDKLFSRAVEKLAEQAKQNWKIKNRRVENG